MATNAVVCPECGAPAAPGRFACAQCGALLAAVAMPSREPATSQASQPDQAPPAETPAAPALPAAEADIDDDPGFDTSPELDLPPTPPGLADIPHRASAPAWPPVADPGAGEPAWPVSPPEPDLRTPAGTYLPPSAVLPPLDGSGVAVAGAGAGAGAGTMSVPASASTGRRLPALDDLFGDFATPAQLTRRAVGVGAALAAVAFLLPWINGLPGAGFNGYLDRWGMAGPGLWIVFVGAAAIGAIALSTGRPTTWPVGLPAAVLGGLVLGLAWPSVFGGGAAIGVWFAFVGALVLVVGGALDLRARHASTESSV